MSDRQLPILVVGAGPAGSSTAIELGRAGIETVLIDRARFPRDKCCGDGLTTGALRRLEAIGLEPRAVTSFTVLDEIAVRSPTGRLARLPLGNGRGIAAATARRVDLDAELVAIACATPNVEVYEGEGFAELEVAKDGVEVRLDSGRVVTARSLVAADGAWSPVRHALGSGAAVGETGFYAYRAYAHGAVAEALRRLLVVFDPALLPGYAWAFPVQGAVNLGICFSRNAREAGAALRARWDALLADGYLTTLLGAGAVVEDPPRAWPIPTGYDPSALTDASGRVLFVGDAAGLADAFTGEGIAQALESGHVAARSIIDGGTDQETLAMTYRSRIAAGLGRDAALARRLRSVMASSFGARGAVAASAASRFTRREVGRWLYGDYPRTIAFTPSVWRKGVLTRSAPYASERT